MGIELDESTYVEKAETIIKELKESKDKRNDVINCDKP